MNEKTNKQTKNALSFNNRDVWLIKGQDPKVGNIFQQHSLQNIFFALGHSQAYGGYSKVEKWLSPQPGATWSNLA